ncbi:MAG: trehalose-phosphatase [Actinomycetes bacterium]
MPLPEPRTADGAAALQLLLTQPELAVLGCDFDGTLAPISQQPEDARALPGAVDALAAVARRLRAVAIISGRPALQVIDLAGFRSAPGLEQLIVFGQYGRERWTAPSDQVEAPPTPPSVDAARGPVTDLVAAAPSGVSLEDKGAALVVHVRGTDDPEAALGEIAPALMKIALNTGLTIEPARMAYELRPPGYDKGRALRSLVEEYAARVVVFVGDDRGDVPAYDMVETLRSEGLAGLTVASASPEVEVLQERADLVVDGPAGVVEFLQWLASGS